MRKISSSWIKAVVLTFSPTEHVGLGQLEWIEYIDTPIVDKVRVSANHHAAELDLALKRGLIYLK